MRYVLLVLLSSCFLACDQKETKKPNVLFIAIDDLRASLGCYGNEMIQSPNLDLLAKDGSLFKNHFVQVPTCGASRYSLLAGIRPKTQDHLRNSIFAKTLAEKEEENRPESFVHHLRRNGYHTVGIGKISHSADGLVYGYEEEVSDKRELPHSWDELLFDAGKWRTGWNAFFAYANGENRQSLKKQVKPYEASEVDDEGYPDGLTTNLALDKLDELASASKPFFLGVGFFKPHLPFNAPKKYWDLYDRNSIPISQNRSMPTNVHPSSLHGSGEFNQYALGEEKADPNQAISDEYAMKLVHAYYASISYIDHQVGKIITKLKSLGQYDNTIIVVWGDHGWHLGDHNVWGKHSIFDRSLKSTLIVKPPNNNQATSIVESIIESVDIYPSLLEMCEIEDPYPLDGQSFVDLMLTESSAEERQAYGYFRKGISLRTSRYRLSKYYREEEPTVELYDHQVDPYETINIAQERPSVVDSLMPILLKGDTGLYDSE